MKSWPILLTLGACATTTGATERALSPPATEVRPVADTYHGVKVEDPYRWLESSDEAEVKAWTAAQTTYARTYLDALEARPSLVTRLRELLGAQLVSHGGIQLAGGRVFAMKFQPPKPQRMLVVLPSLDAPDQAEVLIDPEVLDPSGTTTLDWYRPSPDGKLVAVSISKGGSESGDVVVYDVEKKAPVFETVPRVNGGTAGGDLVWALDGKSYYYTRYPRGAERAAADMMFFVQIYRHTLGTPTEQDTYELGKDFVRIAEIDLDVDKATGRLLATVQNGDGGEFEHYLRTPDGTWRQLTRYEQRIIQVLFAPKDQLYLVSVKDAPRGKLLRMPITETDVTKASVLVPEGQDTIITDFWGAPTVMATDSRLLVTYQLGGPSEIRTFDLDGKLVGTLGEKGAVADVGGLLSLGGDEVLLSRTSYIEPRTVYRVNVSTGEQKPLPLTTMPPVDLSGFEVVREFATSKDGTQVPLNIIRKKGTPLDGNAPCLVTGYGGYGVNITPGFSLNDVVLLEKGVILVEANLRGGGEFGEAWHLAGNLTHKQNVFDDFIAVVDHLVAKKYTSHARTGIMGGSNGGLLMGAVLTQRPDLARVVVSFVGIYDMLRVELSSNGAFNVPEFGTVKDEALFKAMYAYSPYHHVVDGTKYPPVLLLTGENDPRVEPMQSRKMAARLQKAVDGASPVFLVTRASAGHGIGGSLDEAIAKTADAYAFILHELGVP